MRFQAHPTVRRKAGAAVRINAWLLSFSLVLNSWGASNTRIAVVPINPAVAQTADLLTARLSQVTNLTVLERADIERVMREQKLVLEQPARGIQTGRILGAQTLVLMENLMAQGVNTPILSVRLVAVTPGVVLAHYEFPLSMASTAGWADGFVPQLETHLLKLSNSGEAGVTVSLGSIRHGINAGQSVALEQELSTLLRLQLARQPGLLVSERRATEALEEEARGETPAPLTGAYFIDGTINPERLSTNEISVHLRMRPRSGAPVTIQVDGRREQLGELIRELTRKIVAAIGTAASNVTGNAEVEAERFLAEAIWATQWGLWRQATEAADASWFLGKRTEQVAAYRVSGRGAQAMFLRGPEHLGSDPLDKYGFFGVPSVAALTTMTRALELFHEATLELGQEKTPNADWKNYGLHLLPVTARVLEPFYRTVSYRAGAEAELRRLRAAAQELNAWLMPHHIVIQGVTPFKWVPASNAPSLPRIAYPTKEQLVQSLPAAWWESQGLWCDDPGQAFGIYEKLLVPAVYARFRTVIGAWKPEPHEPPLAGWNPEDQRRARALWARFYGRLQADTNVVIRADGHALAMAFSHDPHGVGQSAQQYLELRGDQATYDASLRHLGGSATTYPPALSVSNAQVRLERWGVPQAHTLSAPPAQAIVAPSPEESIRLGWQAFLALATNWNQPLEYYSLPVGKLDAITLQEQINAFEQAEQSPAIRTQDFRQSLVKRALAVLRFQAKEEAAQTPSTGHGVSQNQGPVVTLSRSWHEDDFELPANRALARPFRFSDLFWADDHIWLVTRTTDAIQEGQMWKGALLKINPRTGHREVIETPFELRGAPEIGASVAGGEIAIGMPGAVWIRQKSGTWTNSPVELSGKPLFWKNSVVLSSGDAIVQLMRDSGEQRILASRRRTPAATPLDGLPLHNAALQVWPDQRLYASVAQKLWRYDEPTKNWQQIVSAEGCGESLQMESQGAIYRRHSGCGGPELLAGVKAGSTTLHYYSWTLAPEGSFVRGNPGKPTYEAFTPPWWITSREILLHNRPAQFDGPGIWLFPSKIDYGVGDAQLESIPKNLIYLDPQLDRTLALKIAFAGNLADDEAAFRAMPGAAKPLITPEGLAFVLSDSLSLLWAPRADLATALAHARTAQKAGEHFAAARLTRFDKNRDGHLDPSELAALRKDRSWSATEQPRWTAARDEALKQHGAEWNRLFTEADANRNKNLDAFELAKLAKAKSATMNPRFVGSNANPLQLIRPYDLNSDGSLSLDEFRAFMADPELPSAVNRSGSWLPAFGIPLEQVDTNGDGVLEAQERTEALRLLRLKRGAGGR